MLKRNSNHLMEASADIAPARPTPKDFARSANSALVPNVYPPTFRKLVARRAGELHPQPDSQLAIQHAVIAAKNELSEPQVSPIRTVKITPETTFAPRTELACRISAVVRGPSPNRLDELLTEGAKRRLPTGPALLHVSELRKQPWYKGEVSTASGQRISVFTPNSPPDPDMVKSLVAIDIDLAYLISAGASPSPKSHDFIIASGKYIPRSNAWYDHFFVTEGESGSVYAEEIVHTQLRQEYGTSWIPGLEEGIASYFAHQKFPGPNIHDFPQLPGLKDVLLATTHDITEPANLPLTTPELLQVTHLKGSTFEYHYAYGRLFVEFFAQKYGQEALIKLYSATCAKQNSLYDPQWGNQVLVGGFPSPGTSEARILDAALHTQRINVAQFRNEFHAFLHTQAQKYL